MLTLYRRHQALCPHTSRRFRSWEAASDLVRGWEASGQIGVVKPEVPTVTEAVAKFLDDLEHGQQRSKATLSKHKNLLEKQLLPWCARNSGPVPTRMARGSPGVHPVAP